jgi:hypothetical protein
MVVKMKLEYVFPVAMVLGFLASIIYLLICFVAMKWVVIPGVYIRSSIAAIVVISIIICAFMEIDY